MGDGPVIRRADVSDASACARVVLGWVAATPWMPERFAEAEMTTMIAEAIPHRALYVVGTPVVGYLSLDPKVSLIAGLYVAEQGQGFGKALIDHVKTNRDYLHLWTHAPNKRAQAFYRREGFALTGKTRDGDDGPTELHMDWHR